MIVFDDIWVGPEVCTGEIARDLRADGHAVVGGTPNTDRLEEDRGYAMEVLEAHGVTTLPHREFDEFGAGIRFVEENPGPYAIKPLGEVQNVKRLLYVGRENDGGDVVDVLRGYEKAWGHRLKGFQLQRRVEGVEVAVCGFFNGAEFVEPVNFNFEHKKLFPGNIGPSTGEMGTSMFWSARNRLFDRMLGRIEGWPRRGTSGASTSTASSTRPGSTPWSSRRASATRRSRSRRSPSSPRPASSSATSHAGATRPRRPPGLPGRRPRRLPAIPLRRPEDLRRELPKRRGRRRDREQGGDPHRGREDRGRPGRVAGESGMPLVVTGKGDTIQNARKQAYERVDDIVIPNLYYRDDIGERWIDADGDRLRVGLPRAVTAPGVLSTRDAGRRTSGGIASHSTVDGLGGPDSRGTRWTG